MPDFNRTEASAEPASIAINALLDAGARANNESTRGYLRLCGRASVPPQSPVRL
jgi:hypothetical protein